MAIQNGNGIGYVGDVGSWSVYEVHVDGRAVLEASIDNSDPDLRMYVGRPGARRIALEGTDIEKMMVGVPVATKWTVVKGMHEVGGSSSSPGELKDHIDGMVVQRYIVMGLPQLFADVYVPKPITES